MNTLTSVLILMGLFGFSLFIGRLLYGWLIQETLQDVPLVAKIGVIITLLSAFILILQILLTSVLFTQK